MITPLFDRLSRFLVQRSRAFDRPLIDRDASVGANDRSQAHETLIRQVCLWWDLPDELEPADFQLVVVSDGLTSRILLNIDGDDV